MPQGLDPPKGLRYVQWADDKISQMLVLGALRAELVHLSFPRCRSIDQSGLLQVRRSSTFADVQRVDCSKPSLLAVVDNASHLTHMAHFYPIIV